MNTCRARWVQLDNEPHCVCDVCGPWAEGPCDGLTDDQLVELELTRQSAIKHWQRELGRAIDANHQLDMRHAAAMLRALAAA